MEKNRYFTIGGRRNNSGTGIADNLAWNAVWKDWIYISGLGNSNDYSHAVGDKNKK